MDKKIMEALKLMGLTDYESDAYIALTSLISAGAADVSRVSKVPRSKIYEILKQLSIKGFVDIERGRPLIYHVVPPSEVFRREKKRITDTLDQAQHELTRIYEDRISRVPAPIWLIHGPEKIIKKELEIIGRSRHDIKIRAGFFFPGESKKILQSLKKKFYRGVDVRLMVADDLEDTEPLEVRMVNIPTIKMIVRDSEEMMWVFSRFTHDGSIIPESAIGVWNQYPEIAENYARIFETVWAGRGNL